MDRPAIEEFFAPFAPVSVRRMFSGFGVYIDDACFALVLQGEIWLKADEPTRAAYEAADTRPFSYSTASRAVTVETFRSLPSSAFDDEDELRRWCDLALQAARRTALVKAARRLRQGGRQRRGTERDRKSRQDEVCKVCPSRDS